MATLSPIEVLLVLAILMVPLSVIPLIVVLARKEVKTVHETLYLASLGKRVINSLVDIVAYFVLLLVLIMFFESIGLGFPYTDKYGEELSTISLYLLLPTYWAYYIFFEYKYQRTLGKILTKTKVVTLTGDKPTLRQIVIRTLARNIPFEYFSYFVSVEGIHDKLSKTRVVKINQI